MEEFSGVQAQSARVSPLSVGWVRNRFEAPVGRVAVDYRLYASGDVVWQERIHTEYEAPGRSITGAVLDAMAMTNEKLARRLAEVVRSRPEPRSIEVRVLDGCGLGSERVARLMDEVNEVYEHEVDLSFVADYEVWRPSDFSEVRVEQPRGGIALVLSPHLPEPESGELFAEPNALFGIADTLGGRAVVGCREPRRVRPLTAIHEIAHLFGAVHVWDRSSVMHPVAEFDGRFFDPLNRRILETARERPFDGPLPAEMSGRLGAIYRAAERFPDRVLARDLEAAVVALERVSAP